ncbi:hypothetical protein [Blastomonas sp.]|uniref:hypothetical protein n=1 Tax=Blastomonas sp. TaxID=1909299 RepID=UPI00391D72CC
MPSAETSTLVGLCKIELPTRTLRICDGAFCYFGDEKYTSEDEVFGAIGAIDEFEAAMGDAAEDARLVFNPPAETQAAAIKSKAFQNSRARFWMGDLDADGKTIINPDQLMDGLVDYTVLRFADNSRVVEMAFIGRAEKLFLKQEGNSLNPRWHQSIWPGEKGLNNTGSKITIAWGVAGARGITSYGGGGGGSGGGLFGGGFGQVQFQ